MGPNFENTGWHIWFVRLMHCLFLRPLGKIKEQANIDFFNRPNEISFGLQEYHLHI